MTSLEKRFIAIYEEYRDYTLEVSFNPNRATANLYRFLGGLEVCLIEIRGWSGKLPYLMHQRPTWFGLSSKVFRESYPALIRRESKRLYNELMEFNINTNE